MRFFWDGHDFCGGSIAYNWFGRLLTHRFNPTKIGSPPPGYDRTYQPSLVRGSPRSCRSWKSYSRRQKWVVEAFRKLWYVPGSSESIIPPKRKRKIIDSEVPAGRGYVGSQEGNMFLFRKFSRLWLNICFIFTLTWGNDPIWQAYVPKSLGVFLPWNMGRREYMVPLCHQMNQYVTWVKHGFWIIKVVRCVKRSMQTIYIKPLQHLKWRFFPYTALSW